MGALSSAERRKGECQAAGMGECLTGRGTATGLLQQGHLTSSLGITQKFPRDPRIGAIKTKPYSPSKPVFKESLSKCQQTRKEEATK